MRLTKLALATAMLCLLAAGAFGQGITGNITGIVRDPAGAVVPNATVVARNVATGAEARATSNAEGFYRISNIEPGEYSISVESAGFKRTTLSAQRLSVSETMRSDVTLEIGQVTETVSVEAAASEVQTEDSQMGKVLRDPMGLPVLSGAGGRNPLALAVIQPGVVPAGQVGPFSVNGQRAQANNYMLDGGDSNDLAINVPDAVQNISPNALQEFRLVTGAMKAEFGRNSGAIVQVQTRSGANQWHGGASETFRNTRLNAVPFFQKSVSGGDEKRLASGLPRKPQWNSNDFDAQLGGPIARDRSFFFLNYLGFRRRQGVTSSATVPNDAQRAIIEQRGTPASRALLALVPRASSGNTLFEAPSNALTRDQGLAKWDHNFSDANRFAATYFIEEQSFTDPFAFGGSAMSGFGTVGTLRFQNIILRDTHTFSPTLLNEFRASYHRRGTLSVLPLNTTKLSSLGLGNIIPDDPSAEGPPWVIISGFSSFGNTIQGPQGRADNTFQYLDNVSWARGSHFLKFGGEFRTFAQNQVFDFINNGYMVFDGSGVQQGIVPQIPGLPAALSDFANGFATQFIQNSAGRRGYRTRSANLFFQDDWKVASNLTLNLGLRWEYNTPLTDIENRVNTFRRGQKSTVFRDAPTGLVYPGDAGISDSTYDDDWNNFAPRFGFAWDPLRNGRLSVRGGWGLFYDAPITELTLQFLTSAPFAVQPFTLYTDITDPWRTSRVNPIPQPFPFQPVKPGQSFNFRNIAPIGLTIMDPNFATPYAMQHNVAVQYQLGRSWVAEAAYVGSTGVKLLNRRPINYAIAGPGSTTGNTNPRRVLNMDNPERAQFNNAPFGGITNQLTDANSNFNSLQLYLTKRFASGFSMTHAYTWGKSIDNASGLRVTSRFDNADLERGPSEHDVRHRYVGSFMYELPWGRNQDTGLAKVIGGWGFSGIVTFQTGNVFDVTETEDRCLCGSAGTQRPDWIGSGKLDFFDPRRVDAVTGRPNSWFNGTGGGTSDAATNPYFRRVGRGLNWDLGAGRFGNLGRNAFNGPGINNWDLAIFKRTRITESHSIEFRAEGFNVFNHTQFNNPTTAISSVNFGRILGTRDPRIIQFALRYMF